jgi:transmembrane sensor
LLSVDLWNRQRAGKRIVSQASSTVLNTATSASEASQEQAAQWHVLIQSGEMGANDRQCFEDWIANENNAAIYQRMGAIWAKFDAVDTMEAKSTLKKTLIEKRNQKRPTSTALVSTVLVMLMLVFGWKFLPMNHFSTDYLLADYRTTTGEQHKMMLSDQTQLYINTASAINIEYTETQRTIYLIRGEIQLDVAKDNRRPLIVVSKHGTARALGTQFSVRDLSDSTEVMVTESVVEACSKPIEQSELENHLCQTLTAGQQVIIRSNQVTLPQASDPDFFHDWTRQQLIVDNQPLLDVLDELARYRHGYLHIDRTALAELRISGVFPLNDTDQSLQVIRHSLPIKVRSYSPLLTVIGL